MRRFLLSLITLILLIIAGLYLIVLPTVKKDITHTLESNGFKNIQISKTQFSTSGLNIDKIESDTLGVNNIKLHLFWPTYIFDKKITNIDVEEIFINTNINPTDQNTIPRFKRNLASLNIPTIPDGRIDALNIRLSEEKNITGNLEKKQNTIKGQFQADNQALSFQSQWSLEQGETFKFYTDIQNLNVKNDYLSINRGQGWLSYEVDNNSKINAQLESGSGSLLGAPLNNINALIGKDTENHTLLFRANASGTPGITLKTDAEWGDDFDVSLLKTYLSFPSIKTLNTYLLNNKLINTSLSSTINTPSEELTIEYLPERRFAGGPYPVEIKSRAGDKNNLSANILIYPKSYDIRGTLNGSIDFIEFMDGIIPIQKQKISSDTIRLEGNLVDIQKN